MPRIYQHCPVCGIVSTSFHEWDSLEEFYAADLDEPEFVHDETPRDCGGTLTYRLGDADTER